MKRPVATFVDQSDVLRYMPVRYVAITMLRDPVERIISHYRFHSTLSASPLAAEIAKGGLGVVEYFQRFRETIPLQYETFAPRSRHGADEGRRVDEAVRNLESKISVFGLQSDFDAFAVLLSELLGLPDVSHVALNRTPSDAARVTPDEAAELRRLLADDVAFYEAATKLYDLRKKALPFDLDAQVEAFGREQQAYMERRSRHQHRWRGFYS